MIGLIQFQESWEAGRCVVAEANPPCNWPTGFPTVDQLGFSKGVKWHVGKHQEVTAPPEGTHYNTLHSLSWVLGMKLACHSHVVRPNMWFCLECQRQIDFCTSWLLCGCLSYHCTHCWVLIGRQSSISSDRRSGAALHCVSVSAFVHSPFQCWHQLDHFAIGLLHCGRML